MTQRSIILTWIAVILILAAVVDNYQYEAHASRCSRAVAQLGGRTGSLMGWPWGREVIVSLPRPVTDEELQQLAILSAGGRDYVAVRFNCELTDAQLAAARRVLSRCAVSDESND